MTGVQIGGPFVTFNGQNDGHDVQGPEGMAFAPNGNLYIADVTESNVHIYDTAGNSVGALGRRRCLSRRMWRSMRAGICM